MTKKVKVIILRTAGTNCDQETAFAFRSFHADVDLVHISSLIKREVSLSEYHILAIPGGFTYGDDIISGRILANELKMKLSDGLQKFILEGKLILGICNGFQVLVRAGILPGPLDENTSWTKDTKQNISLTYNDSGKFEDRWIYLRVSGHSIWTQGFPEVIYLPVAHAEGKFVPDNKEVLNQLKKNHQIVFRYCDQNGNPTSYPYNPNGSVDNIAGITDRTGRILGLMPHPERHFLFIQHPFWTRLERKSLYGQGAKIFENGVKYVKEHLLNRPSQLVKF